MDRIQQGDVLVERVESIPPQARPVAAGPRGYVLADGEATGHAHRIEGQDERLDVYEVDGTLYLRVGEESATVTHEEHGAQTIPPGTHRVRRVQEWDYLAQMARPVKD